MHTVQREIFAREKFRQMLLQSIAENIRQFYFAHASKILISFNAHAVEPESHARENLPGSCRFGIATIVSICQSPVAL